MENLVSQLQKTKYRVTKSNILIQSARSKMTAAEMKVIIYAISNIEMGDKEFKPCELSITEFSNMCGVTSDAQYENLRKVTGKLKSRVIEIFSGNGEDEEILQVNWLRYVRYKKGTGTITLQMEDLLAPQLLELKKNFTTYGLVNVLALKSKYSMQLYELLKSYENLGCWIVELDELKRLLYAEQYKNYNDFKKRILDPSLSEIDDKTDLKIDFDLKKEGKKVVGITFKIRENTQIISQRRQEKQNRNTIYNYKKTNKYDEIIIIMDLDRKLIKKEREYIDKWIDTYNLKDEMIKIAYERCIMYTGKLSFPYMDSIFKTWFENGIITPEQAAHELPKGSESLENPKHAPSRSPSYDINELEKMIFQK